MLDDEDRICMGIHGIKWYDSSAGESEDFSDFDEEYERYKPPPIQIDPSRHKIRVVSKDCEDVSSKSELENEEPKDDIKESDSEDLANSRTDDDKEEGESDIPVSVKSKKKKLSGRKLKRLKNKRAYAENTDNNIPAETTVEDNRRRKLTKKQKLRLKKEKQKLSKLKTNFEDLPTSTTHKSSHQTLSQDGPIGQCIDQIVYNLYKCYQLFVKDVTTFESEVFKSMFTKSHSKSISCVVEVATNYSILNLMDSLNGVFLPTTIGKVTKKNSVELFDINFVIEKLDVLVETLWRYQQVYLSAGIMFLEEKQKGFGLLQTFVGQPDFAESAEFKRFVATSAVSSKMDFNFFKIASHEYERRLAEDLHSRDFRQCYGGLMEEYCMKTLSQLDDLHLFPYSLKESNSQSLIERDFNSGSEQELVCSREIFIDGELMNGSELDSDCSAEVGQVQVVVVYDNNFPCDRFINSVFNLSRELFNFILFQGIIRAVGEYLFPH